MAIASYFTLVYRPDYRLLSPMRAAMARRDECNWHNVIAIYFIWMAGYQLIAMRQYERPIYFG